MKVTGFTFQKWWDEQGHYLDPDTEDVSWFDKRAALAEAAFEAGVEFGMARAGNYTANDEVCPTSFTFVNGTRVTCVNNVLFLERGKK
jgi:hypothetical protein